MSKFLVAVEYASQSQAEDGGDAGLSLSDLVRISHLYLSDLSKDITEEQIEKACAPLFSDKETEKQKPKLSLEAIQTSARDPQSPLYQILQETSGSSGGQDKPQKKSLLSSLYSDKKSSAAGAEGEEDDEDDDEEPAIKEKPILRGTLKLVDGILTWSGKWAMSAEKFSAGEKARFKYVFTGVKLDGQKTEQPKEVTPVSGKFTGSFMLKDESAPGGQVKVEETDIEMTFVEPAASKSMYDVQGIGKNNFGSFKLAGKYDPAKCRLAVEKEYEAPADADFQDFSDGDDAEDEIEDDGDDIDKDAELAALKAEANLPVEELRKRYMSGAKDKEEGDAKRAKVD